jgi:predicted nucleic acid-binding Zn ribbon protein
MTYGNSDRAELDRLYAKTSRQARRIEELERQLAAKISPDWKPEERDALAKLGDEQGLSVEAVIRQSVRLYQQQVHRLKNGETVHWSGDEQRARDFAGDLPDQPLPCRQCGKAWEIVRPGKFQPTCNCQDACPSCGTMRRHFNAGEIAERRSGFLCPECDADEPVESLRQPKRLETGVVQAEDDWPGVFIRGDRALRGYAPGLAHLIEGGDDPVLLAQCDSLLMLLEVCFAGNRDVTPQQIRVVDDA